VACKKCASRFWSLFSNLTGAGDIVIRPINAREGAGAYVALESPSLHMKQADAANLEKW
jgi:hypothetical protein